MKEIDRICFCSLCVEKGHYYNHYFILSDGWYQSDFWADNDEEAKKIFRQQKNH